MAIPTPPGERHWRPGDAAKLRKDMEHGPTPDLATFRAVYEHDDKIWWEIGSGHHQNLFEDACDQLEAAGARHAEEVARLRAAGDALAEACVMRDRYGSRCRFCGGDWYANEGHDDSYQFHKPGCGLAAYRAALSAGTGEGQ